MERRNVTFDDIAKYTHFSKTTISRYFNNPDSLTLENQQKIADALVALNYKENKVARILASGKTEIVGIMIPNFYLHYYSQMLNRILSSYETYGYKFLVFAGNENKDIERQYFQELLSYRIEGLIVLSYTISSEELASYNLPVVTIERENRCTCSVNSDNYKGAILAAELLQKNSCDVLIHINGNVAEKTPSYQRIRGFEDFCTEQRLIYDLMLSDLGNTYEKNVAGISQSFELIEQKYKGKKKGIFLANDTYANIFLNLLFKKYGRLPGDYQLIGFDDSPISREAVIPISTVSQQIDKMAEEAMNLLLMQMNERRKRRPTPLPAPIHCVVPPVLIERETTS